MKFDLESENAFKGIIEGRSLFSKLFTYRGRENFKPEENFFTEGFAFILDHDRELLKNFFKLLDKKSIEPWLLPKFLGEKPKVETQKLYRSKYGRRNFIDLEIKSGGSVLWIEVKIGSGLSGENQIKKYEELITQNEQITDKENSGIMLLSKSKLDVETDHLYYRGEIYWSEIYTLIKDNLETVEQKNYRWFIEKDYLKFIEERGMIPFEQFTKLDQDAAAQMKSIDINVQNVLAHISETIKKEYSNKEPSFSSTSRSRGPGYIGITASVGNVEIYFGIVNQSEEFGDIHIWYTPNSDHLKVMPPGRENLKDIGFDNHGGDYLYKSQGKVKVFDNANYPKDSSALVIKKLRQIFDLISQKSS